MLLFGFGLLLLGLGLLLLGLGLLLLDLGLLLSCCGLLLSCFGLLLFCFGMLVDDDHPGYPPLPALCTQEKTRREAQDPHLDKRICVGKWLHCSKIRKEAERG